VALVDSVPLKITDDPTFLASRRYRYQQNPLTLTIDMHYIIQSSGDVQDFLKKHIFSEKSGASILIHENQVWVFMLSSLRKEQLTSPLVLIRVVVVV
jgi:cyanosortase A-associated protein